MGMVAPVCELMMHENQQRPITGDVLFIGRQDIFLTPNAFSNLLQKYQQHSTPSSFLELNKIKTQTITDKSFMSFFGINSLTFMDVSDYEGADIVWDLNLPVPADLHNRFDFIFNGSCLDNMFNPSGAMLSLTNMLRPGGRILHLEHATSFNGPYLMFPPGWFFDYYVQNAFADCQVYVGDFTGLMDLYFGPWRLYSYDWRFDPNGTIPSNGRHYMVVVLAEKGTESTSHKLPIQAQYRRDPAVLAEFDHNVRRVLASNRRIFAMGIKSNPGGHGLLDLGPICHDLYHGNYPHLG